MKNKLSCLIACKNGGATLDRAIQSVPPDIPIIVGLHNSSDGSEGIVARYPNCTAIHVTNTYHLTEVRKALVEYASSQVVFFLDADDESSGKCIEIAQLLHNGYYDLVLSPVKTTDMRRYISPSNSVVETICKTGVQTTGMYWRRESLLKLPWRKVLCYEPHYLLDAYEMGMHIKVTNIIAGKYYKHWSNQQVSSRNNSELLQDSMRLLKQRLLNLDLPLTTYEKRLIEVYCNGQKYH